jgi:hypothetical protein
MHLVLYDVNDSEIFLNHLTKRQMKKNLLLCLLAAIGFTAHAQNRLAHPRAAAGPFVRERNSIDNENLPSQEASVPYAAEKRNPSAGGNTSQSLVNLGTAANALTAIGIRNFLWADPSMNLVMFTHRTTGGTTGVNNNGRFYYDISFNGGTTFDTTKGPVYTPSLSAVTNPSNARFPQAAIFNPAGTGNPNDAYMTYYGAALDSTNLSLSPNPILEWGGNVHGVYKLDQSSIPTQHEIISDSTAGVGFVIPELMHMCKNGNTYALSLSKYGNSDIVNGRGVNYDYTGIVIWEKGVWNSTTNDYDYTQQLVSLPSGTLPYNAWYAANTDPNNLPVSTMISASTAFNDNGQTGYLVCKQFLNTNDSPDSSALLYIYKTTNGGANWQQMLLPNLDQIDPLCVDSGFGMGISGQVFDVTVDANDNPHIIVVVGSKYMSATFGTSVYYQENYGSLFDIYTTTNGTTWVAHKLMSNPIQQIYGAMGNPSGATTRQVYDQRPQITRSYDGTKLFFSWFETDTAAWLPDPNNGGYDNQHPDMHIIGYDVTNNMWTPEKNATAFPALNGDADGICWLGTTSYYALPNGSGGYKIPAVFGLPTATTTNGNPDWEKPFQFKYIDGVEIQSNEYTVAPIMAGSANANEAVLFPTGITPVSLNTGFVVTPAQPNPTNSTTKLMVQISRPGKVVVELHNLLGQLVSSKSYGKQQAGVHGYTIDVSGLYAGIYMCTVNYDGQKFAQKLSVQ